MGFLIFLVVTILVVVIFQASDSVDSGLPFFGIGLLILIAEMVYSFVKVSNRSGVLSILQIVLYSVIGFLVWILTSPLHLNG